ncbi:Alginate biosynthesis transcriptional regulatory protein AlgB [Planctomycetes bacterium CA13]|uniref:Alginate biosynthesis transcriptional regulatory protein AlgB n=1 Tax=Novipirellula herctigrandis TaxID=2527986 RepID=A0A5C5Z1C5_9BACT|nr:Alginate biosynthesis transcriptional regulatory protein AlgB [Planctomycetes bacterium CA13]
MGNYEANVMEKPISILLVEDDHDFRDSCARWMQRKGHHVVAAASGAEALAICQRHDFDVGVIDLNMPGMSGIELLQRIRGDNIDLEVVILTGQGTIESAVQAMKMGASDYLTKPCPLGELEHHCALAHERSLLRRENQQLKAILSRNQTVARLVGDSPEMKRVAKWIERIAPTDKPVLITGESGTGKEVVAKSIWRASHLSHNPFVTINCAALPETLVESELFGHQKGSFTGATADKPGLFEVASGGTLFIDELGEMPLSLQPKLLRVLEDGSMRRIGSHKERKVNVRVIAATNRDLSEDVQNGSFREDLFYRVNVLPIDLPPLRNHVSDVDQLIDYFMPDGWSIDAAARHAMNEHPWPGNVRELINVIQRATILADNDEITLDDLPRELTHHDRKHDGEGISHRHGVGDDTSDRLDDIAKDHILYILDRENGNKAKSARVLGIHRRKLYRLLERYHLTGQTASSSDNESSSIVADVFD